MSRAREFADLAGSADAGGITGKNLIINGAMNIFQRATSATGIVSEAYHTADRFKTNMSDAGTFTVSQSTTVPAGQGLSNSLKLDCTTADASVAAGSYMSIDHRIEAQNLQRLNWGTSSAKKLTISFWVRSNLTGTYVLEFLHGDAFVYNSNTYTIDAANTWEKKIITISGYTPTAINDDNGIGLYIFWWLQAGSTYGGGTTTNDTWHTTQANRAGGLTVDLGTSTDNEFYLTGIQLEVGEQATPFEHRSIGDELIRCQRYYVRHTGGSTNLSGLSTGVIYSSTAALTAHTYITPMRSSPTIGTDSLNAITQMQVVRGGAASAVSVLDAYGDTLGARIDCTITSGTTGQGAYLQIMTGYVDFDAEL